MKITVEVCDVCKKHPGRDFWQEDDEIICSQHCWTERAARQWVKMQDARQREQMHLAIVGRAK